MPIRPKRFGFRLPQRELRATPAAKSAGATLNLVNTESGSDSGKQRESWPNRWQNLWVKPRVWLARGGGKLEPWRSQTVAGLKKLNQVTGAGAQTERGT